MNPFDYIDNYLSKFYLYHHEIGLYLNINDFLDFFILLINPLVILSHRNSQVYLVKWD